jgi:hypothetical protein
MAAQENALKSAIRTGYCPSVPGTCPHMVRHVRGVFLGQKAKLWTDEFEASESYLTLRFRSTQPSLLKYS